jgi:hypothetical protein
MKLSAVRRYPMVARLGIVCGLVASLVLMAAVPALAQPAPWSGLPNSAAPPKPPSDEFTTTEQYLIQFYPRWFTYNQWRQSTHNRTAGPDRISPLYHVVVAINDDTLYASSVMELADEPVVLTIRETPVTYSILALDPYGDVFESNIPKQAGAYLLTGPDFDGAAPPGVTQIPPMPLNDFFLIFRADKHTSTGENVIAQAEVFRSTIEMAPLCAYENLPCPEGVPQGGSTLIVPELAFAIPFKTIADDLIAKDPIKFLQQLQEAVASPETPPLSPSEQALSDHFDLLFGTGDVSKHSDFAAGAQAAHQAILDDYLTNVGPTQWIHFTNIGDWKGNVLDRSAITEFIQYGNNISAAAYYQTFNDDRGQPLNGNNPHGYVLTFPKGTLPEAERFWSITAYTPDAIELIANPLNKYLIGDYTPGLQYDADGSLSIYLSTEPPAGVPVANWLPVANGPFNIMLRVYGVVPGSDVANNTYVPPPVVRSRGGGK